MLLSGRRRSFAIVAIMNRRHLSVDGGDDDFVQIVIGVAGKLIGFSVKSTIEVNH